MSRRRFWRGCAVYLGPLTCATAALLALLWAQGLGGSGESAATDGTELTELVSEVTDALAGDAGGDSSPESFLADLDECVADGAWAGSSGVARVSWTVSDDLVDAASAVLEAYEEVDGVSLATSGYLDLQGNAWGAIVRGGTSWVDIVLVTTDDDETSLVQVVRLAPEDVDGGT